MYGWAGRHARCCALLTNHPGSLPLHGGPGCRSARQEATGRGEDLLQSISVPSRITAASEWLTTRAWKELLASPDGVSCNSTWLEIELACGRALCDGRDWANTWVRHHDRVRQPWKPPWAVRVRERETVILCTMRRSRPRYSAPTYRGIGTPLALKHPVAPLNADLRASGDVRGLRHALFS